MKGFKNFLFRGNVVDLAVAVVVGAAFSELVKAVVQGLLTPLIGVFGGVPDFSALVLRLHGSTFRVGEVVDAVVGFVVMAGVIYFLVVAPLARLGLSDAVPSEKYKCPECRSKIPVAARRCAYCTAIVGPSKG
ncbi:MAG TPA: large conductance mechanosensitive channel protein MscL [Chloroflexota bacterium]|nr:large conductance mechanosensitive channel protein MscL [Chloroflexota bacterium]